MKLTDCMQKQAIELLNFRIMIDPEFNIIDRRLRYDWQTKLMVLQVAKLIIKYFSPNVLWQRALAKFTSIIRSLTTIMRMPHSYVTTNL